MLFLIKRSSVKCQKIVKLEMPRVEGDISKYLVVSKIVQNQTILNLQLYKAGKTINHTFENHQIFGFFAFCFAEVFNDITIQSDSDLL